MTKGTPSMGKKNKRTHLACRRCGKKTLHVRKKICSACGYGKSAKIKKFSWQWKRVLGKTNRKK